MNEDFRYIVQRRLPEVGKTGQRKLNDARILIVGCGALGSPIAMYLAGAGIGHIHLADFDNIELSNLHRQVFYREEEVGKAKAEVLAQRLRELNSSIEITFDNSLVNLQYLKSQPKFDVIIDAADNPSTTYMLDDYCKSNQVPLSTAGVTGWKAQVFTYIPGSYSYSDCFPKPAENSGLLPCSVSGIVGPTASLAASIQASEVLKLILGISKDCRSNLVTVDLLNNEYISLNSD